MDNLTRATAAQRKEVERLLGVTRWMKLTWKMNTLFGLWPRALLLDELRRHRESMTAIHWRACCGDADHATLEAIRNECELQIDALRFSRPNAQVQPTFCRPEEGPE